MYTIIILLVAVAALILSVTSVLYLLYLQVLYIAVRGISPGTNSFKLAVYNDLFLQSAYPVTVQSNVNDGNAIITLSTTRSSTDS